MWERRSRNPFFAFLFHILLETLASSARQEKETQRHTDLKKVKLCTEVHAFYSRWISVSGQPGLPSDNMAQTKKERKNKTVPILQYKPGQVAQTCNPS